VPSRDIPPNIPIDSARTNQGPPRNGVYQQALTQALPSGSNSAQKRSASARSPSPTHPNKLRRTDLPTAPRAMHRDGHGPNTNGPNPRSLLDRVGGPPGRGGPKNHHRDEIQARIDNIVSNSPDQNMMMPPGFPGMGMDMNAMAAANMANPMMLQEMMMNQMALMAQMASSMGIINPANGQFGGGPGFPMQQGGMQDMNMFPPGMNNGFPQQQQQQQMNNNGAMNGGGRGRGGARGGRGTGRGRGGSAVGGSSGAPQTLTPVEVSTPPVAVPVPIAAPSPVVAAQAPAAQPAYALPERPQSPTLCKFASKCTNAHCRYSHPSPVATAESGVVLSNDPCEKGKACKDKDCIKAHVSPAVLNPNGLSLLHSIITYYLQQSSTAQQSAPPAAVPPPQPQHAPVPCRFGASCTRPGCTFSHPPRQTQNQFATQCRFGTACTRAQCAFQHPEGRVLPSTFHRGLSTSGPIVSVPAPETGSMSGSSHNRSVTFNNNAAIKEKYAQQMKEIQAKKDEVEKAVKEAEAAANSKKDDSKPVSITA